MLSDNFLISISIRVKIKHPFTGELLPYEIIICNSFHNNRNFPAKDKNSLVPQRELFSSALPILLNGIISEELFRGVMCLLLLYEFIHTCTSIHISPIKRKPPHCGGSKHYFLSFFNFLDLNCSTISFCSTALIGTNSASFLPVC